MHYARSQARKAILANALFSILLVALFSGAFASSSPAAVSGPFCPGHSGSIALNAYPGRCVWVFHNRIAFVDFTNVLTNVNKCAVVKPNADGSGGNVGGQVECRPRRVVATVFFPPNGVSGYATGINNSTNYHTGFKGLLTLY